MEFFDALKKALADNGGRISLQQATDLLPNSAKHKVMSHLNAARNSGVCKYTVKRNEGGRGEIIITSPDTVAPQATPPVVPPGTPPVGGSN